MRIKKHLVSAKFQYQNIKIPPHSSFMHPILLLLIELAQHRPLLCYAGTEGEPSQLRNSNKYRVYLQG